MVAIGGNTAELELDWPDYVLGVFEEISLLAKGREGATYHHLIRGPSRSPAWDPRLTEPNHTRLACLFPYDRRVYTFAGVANWVRIGLTYAVLHKKGR